MVTFKSSSVNRLGFPRGAGVYPVKDVGVVTIASNTTLSSATTDTLQLCYIPPNCFISDWKIFFQSTAVTNASVVFALQDSLASPTTYMTGITQFQTGGGVIGMSGGVVAVTAPDTVSMLNAGTMYGATARSIGTTGAPVVVWASGVLLNLVCTTTSTTTSAATARSIIYMVEFTPSYDQGV